MRLLGLVAAIGLAGCASRYDIRLRNDTGTALDVAVLEAPSRQARISTSVAADGWFEFRVEAGRAGPGRILRLSCAGAREAAELDLTGVQLFRARALIQEGVVQILPLRPGADDRRPASPDW